MTEFFFLSWAFLLILNHRFYWVSRLPKDAQIPGHVLISHRGLKRGAPENTVEAYLDAVKNGFSWIELDVISTKDKVLICSHNFDLESETEGRGYIHKLVHKELNFKIIEGNKGKTDLYNLPKFHDVLNRVPNNIGLNIEIKTSSIFDLSSTRALVKFLNALKDRPYVITTFNPFVVIYFRVFFRNVPVGLILESFKYKWLVNWIHPHLLIPRADMLNKELFNYCKNKNLPILTWTVNNIHAINWCKNKNIFGIITDIER